MTFLPGSIAKIQWSFDDPIRGLVLRAWYFTSSDEPQREEQLARIFRHKDPQIYNTSLPAIAIEKPATLVLENLNRSYDGTYRFVLFPSVGIRFEVEVVVFIAGK